MDGLSAAASVIAVADVGAKLAFTLYQVAASYKSAAKDIQSIAKNTTLFAAVLRDLGHTLERAYRNSNVRAEAFENCQNVIDECEGVFQDIQRGLKIDLDGNLPNIDRLKRLKWLVAKPKVDLWQARLESLKATISVQVAVLNYGELLMPMTPRIGSRSRQAEWLALQAMIMAEKTAQTDYQKLLASQSHGFSVDGSPFREPTHEGFVNNVVLPRPQKTPVHGYSGIKGIDFLDDDEPLSEPWSTNSTHPNDQSPKIQILDHSSKYLELWSELDVIEHAIRKVDLATWETERLQDNLIVRSQRLDSRDRLQEVDKTKLKVLIKRLGRRLVNAGFSDRDIQMLVEHLKQDRPFYGLGDGRRRLVNLGKGNHMGPLRSTLEIDARPDMKLLDGANTWRWMPDLLDDFLWAHTCHTLNLTPFKKPQMKLSSQDVANIRDSRHAQRLSREDSDERLRLAAETEGFTHFHRSEARRSQSSKETEAAKYIAERERESIQRKKMSKLRGQRDPSPILKHRKKVNDGYQSTFTDSEESDDDLRNHTNLMKRKQRHRRSRPAKYDYSNDEAQVSSDKSYCSSDLFERDEDMKTRKTGRRSHKERAIVIPVMEAQQETQDFDPNWSLDRARELINKYLYV